MHNDISTCIVTHHDATNGVVSNENYVSPTSVIFVLKFYSNKLTRNHFSFSPFLEFTSETRHTHTTMHENKQYLLTEEAPHRTRHPKIHPSPASSSSNGSQQITPSFLPSFLSFFLFFSFLERCPFHLFHLEGEKKQKKKKNKGTKKRNKTDQRARTTDKCNSPPPPPPPLPLLPLHSSTPTTMNNKQTRPQRAERGHGVPRRACHSSS